MRPVALPAVAALVLGLAPAAVRADSLRCAGGLVSVGDTKLDLLGKCGEPALVDPHTEERGRVQLDAQQVATTRRAVVTVEQWTYDFGPSSFVQLVTLEGGKVIAIVDQAATDGWTSGFGLANAKMAPPGAIPARADSSMVPRCGSTLDHSMLKR